jgi:hypothetical protein
LSSAATEAPSLTWSDASAIDPRLLDIAAFDDDDLFKTSTQSNTVVRSADRQSEPFIGNVNDSPPLPSAHFPQDHVQALTSLVPRFSTVSYDDMPNPRGGFGILLDTDPSELNCPLSTTVTIPQKASINACQRQHTSPTKSGVVLHALSAPVLHTLRLPFSPQHDVQQSAIISACVRRNLSAAQSARRAADLYASWGDNDAAAHAIADAMHWEKQARRRQKKNDSQNRIRALKRVKKPGRWR